MANINDDDDREAFPQSDDETWIENDEKNRVDTFPN